MNLLLLSGGDYEDNSFLINSFFDLLKINRPSVTFIPSCFDYADEYYDDFCELFRGVDFKKVLILPPDHLPSSAEISHAFKSDFIFMSGGNTFYFLKHLRQSGIFKGLKQYLDEGGALGGLSAGAIMMTPSIRTASFPSFDHDDNEVNLKNWKALNLVNFEFFPHYLNTKRYIHSLNQHSRHMNQPLYACPDGSGIIVSQEKWQFFGSVWGFFRGKKYLF